MTFLKLVILHRISYQIQNVSIFMPLHILSRNKEHFLSYAWEKYRKVDISKDW